MFRIEVYTTDKLILEVVVMKNKNLMWIIGIVSFFAAVSAALTAFLIVKDKQKKDDEELMEYLDNSIE